MIAATNNVTKSVKPAESTHEPIPQYMIDRRNKLAEQKKELERQARQLDKELKTIEKSICDTLDAAGGEMISGNNLLYFEYVNGVPSYKSICEMHIAPGVLVREVNNTPKRRKLVIESA